MKNYLRQQWPLMSVLALMFGMGIMAPGQNSFALWNLSSGNFRWWQPLTYIWLHGPWWHLLLNLYALWLFASALGPVKGWVRTLSIFLLSGLLAGGGFLLATLNSDVRMAAVGASGAIMGLMVWASLDLPELRLVFWVYPRWSFSTLWVMGGMFAFDLYLAYAVDFVPVALLSHAAGALGGCGGRFIFRCGSRGVGPDADAMGSRRVSGNGA